MPSYFVERAEQAQKKRKRTQKKAWRFAGRENPLPKEKPEVVYKAGNAQIVELKGWKVHQYTLASNETAEETGAGKGKSLETGQYTWVHCLCTANRVDKCSAETVEKFHDVIRQGDLAGVKQALAEHPALVSCPLDNKTGDGCLTAALKANQQSIAEYLCKEPPDGQSLHGENGYLHHRANNRSTPLHIAAFKGHEWMVTSLLEAGAHVNAKTKGGWLPVHNAANQGHRNIVRMLLQKWLQTSQQQAPLNPDSGLSHYTGASLMQVITEELAGEAPPPEFPSDLSFML
jgi:hypothetical protein